MIKLFALIGVITVITLIPVVIMLLWGIVKLWSVSEGIEEKK